MLNRWQKLYRRLIFRLPRTGAAYRWLVWRWRGMPKGGQYIEPFPRWFGITAEEEEWARGLIEDNEAHRPAEG